MVLTIDIGNTNILLGVFKGNELLKNWRLASRTARTSDEYALDILSLLFFEKLKPEDIEGVIISSVVPPLDPIFERCIEKTFHIKPIFVDLDLDLGIKIDIENPKEIGMDRVVGSVAAFNKTKTSTIVVDFGTATTFDVVNKDGVFIGGAIAPGVLTSLEGLFLRTAKLPKVELSIPPSVIGRDTVNAIRSGILYGWGGMVERIAEEIEKKLGKIKIVVTGGVAHLVTPLIRREFLYDRFLTLEGLKIVYDRNR